MYYLVLVQHETTELIIPPPINKYQIEGLVS